MELAPTTKRKSSLPVAIVLAAGLIGIDLLCYSMVVQAAEKASVVPAPAIDQTTTTLQLDKAVLAGGCFWGVQAVFQHVDGVEMAVSGYAGGQSEKPTYGQVSAGVTGHAEAVEITYDPQKVSYGKLLQIFFSVAHDPTQLNRQGPDVGTQYRSAIFITNDEQATVVEAYIDQLGAEGPYSEPIVTEVSKLETFYPAEDYHQDYATLHPDQPYIVWNDRPKIENLRSLFPDVWRDEPRLVMPTAGAS